LKKWGYDVNEEEDQNPDNRSLANSISIKLKLTPARIEAFWNAGVDVNVDSEATVFGRMLGNIECHSQAYKMMKNLKTDSTHVRFIRNGQMENGHIIHFLEVEEAKVALINVHEQMFSPYPGNIF
jgi:hypothetical protein